MTENIIGGATIDLEIELRYHQVLERIAKAARAVGRDPDQVRLIVVTKGQPLERVEAVVKAGARRLGENYAEEGVEKMQALSAWPEVEWHMIGHVQSRKARMVAQYYAWVHSLDSYKLAQRLDRFAGELGRILPVLMEFNVSGEQTKFGFSAWQEEQWGSLLDELSPIMLLSNIRICGLMTIAPYSTEPEAARPYFRRLRRLQGVLARRFPQVEWRELSMGMSADFEVAIEEGATMVRIGEAILGPRPG
jgi:pyridoxal phosphate enzyme (YggS family)